MERSEAYRVAGALIEARSTDEGLRIDGEQYSLLFRADRPYAEFYDAHDKKWASFFLAGSVNSREGSDETYGVGEPEWLQQKGLLTVRIPIESTQWAEKTAVWNFRDDVIETYFEIKGSGHITDCRYFGGHYADGKDSGFFPSGATFKTMFTPEPDSSERPIRPASESATVNVTGMSLPGRKDWFFTPAPYCFGYNRDETASEWLMMGVAAKCEAQNFTEYRYEERSGAFSLALDYESHTQVEDKFVTPSVLLHFSDDPYQGLADHGTYAEQLGYLEPHPTRLPEEWWRKPIFCGWGVQAELSAEQPEQSAQTFARQTIYDECLETLADQGIVPGTVTIDDKWQTAYGTNEVDMEKWPNIAAWIEGRHQIGQKVLLWLKAWDGEGLPGELCIRNRQGVSVGVDPSNPEYEAMLRQQVHTMLAPDGYNADGFKIDFTARTPSGQSLESYGIEWGSALLHRLLATIYDEAKRTKPDALVVTHTPNPWFRDVTDMIRLNDVNCGASVVPQMIHRAKVARAACPDHLIDTDNWPMPSIEEWRKYLHIQQQLGVPALYFAAQVAGHPLEKSDYSAIQKLWSPAKKLTA
jgi:hypothetical protein